MNTSTTYQPGDQVTHTSPYWPDVTEIGIVVEPAAGDDPEPRCLSKVTPGRWLLVEWPAHPDRAISGARFWERADALRSATH